MLSNTELYGTEDVPQIPQEVIDKRIELLTARFKELISVHYMKQDNQTINQVVKAREFWRNINEK